MWFSIPFFLICFYRSPLQILLETKRFASIEDFSCFSAPWDLPETFIKIFFSKFCKFVFLNVSFFESLQLEKKGFSSFLRTPWGIFGTKKLMKFYQKIILHHKLRKHNLDIRKQEAKYTKKITNKSERAFSSVFSRSTRL